MKTLVGLQATPPAAPPDDPYREWQAAAGRKVNEFRGWVELATLATSGLTVETFQSFVRVGSDPYEESIFTDGLRVRYGFREVRIQSGHPDTWRGAARAAGPPHEGEIYLYNGRESLTVRRVQTDGGLTWVLAGPPGDAVPLTREAFEDALVGLLES